MPTLDMEALLERVEYKYESNHSNTYLFIVVGAGGTGGYLIPNLARMISMRNKLRELEGHAEHQIVILDADDVEDKNLTRQQFVTADIGKNKAKVMASRYSRGFGLTIGYREEYLETDDQLDNLINAHPGKIPVFIDCVDNNKTRLLMNYIYAKQRHSLFLSSGNKEKTGQVIFSYNTPDISSPTFWDIFPDAALDKLPTELSCAEAAESAPQNIHANLTAANLLVGFVNKLLSAEVIEQPVVFFDIMTQQTQVFRGTYHDMVKVLQLVENNAALTEFIPEPYLSDKNIPLPTEENEVVRPTWGQLKQEADGNGE